MSELMYVMSQGIRVNNVIDHLTKAPTDEQYDELASDGRMFESASLAEVEDTYTGHLESVTTAFMDAIKTKVNRIDRTMAGFGRQLNAAMNGAGLAAGTAEIGAPAKAGALAIITARFPLTDGQSIAIVFHSPTNNPAKIVGDDELIAFRFLLNKRDVTHVVAPHGGQDISLKQVCLVLSNLAERNSAKFVAKQDDMKAKEAELATLQTNTEQLQAEADGLVEQADTLTTSAQQAADEEARARDRLAKAIAENDRLRGILAGLGDKVQPEPEPAPAQEKKQPELYRLDSRLAKDITNSLKTIAGIDAGTVVGYTRALFVNSVVGKIKTAHKNGRQDVVNAALALIAEAQKGLAKPLIAERNSVWSLGTLPEPTRDPLALAGVQRDEVYHDLKIKGLDAEKVVIDRASGDDTAVFIFVTERGKEHAALMTIDPAELKQAIETAKTTPPNQDAERAAWDAKIDGFTPQQARALADAAGVGSRLAGQELKAVLKELSVDALAKADAIAKTDEIKPTEAQFWYGLRARPLSLGAQPKDSVAYIPPEQARTDARIADVVALAGESSVRHGAIGYDRELTAKEIADYELVDFAKVKAPWDEAERADRLAQLREIVGTLLGGGEDTAAIWKGLMVPKGELVTNNPFYDYDQGSYRGDQVALALQEAGYSGSIQAMFTALADEVAAQADANKPVNLRDPYQVTAFNPYNDGDAVKLGDTVWTIKNDTDGWYLTDTGDWKGKHAKVKGIKDMVTLIGMIEREALQADALNSPDDESLLIDLARSNLRLATKAITEFVGRAPKGWQRNMMTGYSSTFTAPGIPEAAEYRVPAFEVIPPASPDSDFESDGYYVLPNVDGQGAPNGTFKVLVGDGGPLAGADSVTAWKEAIDAIKNDYEAELTAHEQKKNQNHKPAPAAGDNQWNETNPAVLAVLEKLEELRTTENDYSLYGDRLDTLADDLQQADPSAMERYEPYLIQVANRLTELMEAA